MVNKLYRVALYTEMQLMKLEMCIIQSGPFPSR